MTAPIDNGFRLPGLGHQLAPKGGDDAKTAAKKLEAYFMRHLLKQVRKSGFGGGALSGGFGNDMFREMMDEALADSMAKAGGLGINKILSPELSRQRAISAYASKGSGQLSVLPVPGKMASGFGPRITPVTKKHRFHYGVDLWARMGTPARAAAGGKVLRAERAGAYGNLVVVDHGGGLQTRYAHLSAFDVQPGDIVEAGDTVGRVGSTGRSMGPHLHFEVFRGGKPVDPVSELPGLKK